RSGRELRQPPGHRDGQHPGGPRRRRGPLLQHGHELQRGSAGGRRRWKGRPPYHRERICPRPRRASTGARPFHSSPPAAVRGPGGMRSASAIALAGGRSARFGSDKALATFRGAPLLQAVLRGLRAEFGEVLVVAKRAEPYAAFGARVVLDRSELYTPLSGLEAGLFASSAPAVFCCAADMPFA